VHWKNSGAAFGILQGFGDVFTVLAILVAIAIIYYFPQVPRQDWTLRLAMGLQLGGALGNLIDRVTQGSVIDFISIGTFPVFNVADSSISVGVAILILGLWFKERGSKAEQSAQLPESEASPPTDLPDGSSGGGQESARGE
jgi:signal peptidase II